MKRKTGKKTRLRLMRQQQQQQQQQHWETAHNHKPYHRQGALDDGRECTSLTAALNCGSSMGKGTHQNSLPPSG